jgi:hypothetical protein
MSAKTPRGSTVILRPQRLAKSSQAYIGYDEPKLLKIDTYHGFAQTGTSIVGVFNVCQYSLPELVSLSDFPGTESGTYIIRSFITGNTSTAMTQKDVKAFIHIDLDVKGYDILTAHPVFSLTRKGNQIQLTNLGLCEKMSGSTAVVATQCYNTEQGHIRVWTSLKALGTLGVWIDQLPSMSLEDDFFIVMFGRPVPLHCVKVSEANARVLEIDLERTWKEGDYNQTWSNEVAVEMMIK